MSKKCISLFIFGLILFGALFYFGGGKKEFSEVTVNGQTLHVEVVKTEEETAKGLGYRESLPQNQGMIFVLKDRAVHPFWMKGMRFSLDFVWIDGDVVVDITKNVPVGAENGQPPLIYPSQPVDKVLEVNAGVAERLGIKIGDKVYTR